MSVNRRPTGGFLLVMMLQNYYEDEVIILW